MDITEDSKLITVQEQILDSNEKSTKSEINTASHATSPDHDEQKKKNSNCKICQISKTCNRTLCEKCLYSYVSMVEADYYCCKLCDQKNKQKEIVINHDKDHFASLFIVDSHNR